MIELDHKYYFIIFFASLLVYVVCAKLLVKRICYTVS